MLLVAMTAVLFSSCSKKNNTTPTVRYDYNLDEYITLCDYTGIPIKTFSDEVTRDDIETQILLCRIQFADSKEITERAAEKYDKVNIDYTGYMNGELFENGTAKDQELVLGSGSFIPGFEDGLLGIMPGETVTLDLVFPTPYPNNPDIAGKAVVFVVTVNKIYELDMPEYNDEFVKSNYKYSTTEDFEDAVKKQLQASMTKKKTQYETSQVLDYVLDNTTVNKYPQKEYDELYSDSIEYYDYYASQADMKIEEYAINKLSYKTYDDFLADIVVKTKEYMKEEMVLYMIARRENITVSDDEYKSKALEYAQYYGLASVEAIEQYIEPATIRENILFDKVMTFLADKAVKTAEE